MAMHIEEHGIIMGLVQIVNTKAFHIIMGLVLAIAL